MTDTSKFPVQITSEDKKEVLELFQTMRDSSVKKSEWNIKSWRMAWDDLHEIIENLYRTIKKLRSESSDGAKYRKLISNIDTMTSLGIQLKIEKDLNGIQLSVSRDNEDGKISATIIPNDHLYKLDEIIEFEMSRILKA